MYRVEELKTNLFGLLGWKSDFLESPLLFGLTESRSGLYYQSYHPLLTLSNLKSIAPDFTQIKVSDWTSETEYAPGDLVLKEKILYRAKNSNQDEDPESSDGFWEKYDFFSDWLKTKTEDSILKTVQSIWSHKLEKQTAKGILESRTLFDGTGRIHDLISNNGKIVGLEITLLRDEGITLKLNRIGLQMTGAEELEVFLYHSSRKDPIKTFQFTRKTDGGMDWLNLPNIYLPYASSEIDSGGSWYLVYNQNDLQPGVEAINKNQDWSQSPQGRTIFKGWKIWSSLAEIHPFSVENSNSPDLWDIRKNHYTYDKTWGFNLQFSLECDLTQLILDNQNSFTSLIGLQVAKDLLREMAYNPNFNINRLQQNFNRNEILYELDGDSQGYEKSGLGHEYQKTLEGLSLNLSSLGKICLPCNNKGVKFKVV